MFCQEGNTIKAFGGVEHWGVMPMQVGSEFSFCSMLFLIAGIPFLWCHRERPIQYSLNVWYFYNKIFYIRHFSPTTSLNLLQNCYGLNTNLESKSKTYCSMCYSINCQPPARKLMAKCLSFSNSNHLENTFDPLNSLNLSFQIPITKLI